MSDLKQALQTLVEYAKWLQDMSKSLNQGPASLTDEQRDDLFQRASDSMQRQDAPSAVLELPIQEIKESRKEGRKK